MEGAKALRKEFLEYQRDFYKQAANRAAAYPIKAYMFGDKNDKAKTFLFAEMLKRQQIELNYLPDNWKGDEYEKGSSFIVSLNQPQHSLIRAIFEKTLDYNDSLFYDITAWTLPLAFGLPYTELTSPPATGAKVETLTMPKGEIEGGKSEYAYLLEWDELYAPAAVNEMLNAGLILKVATNKFDIAISNGNKKFDYGTILIPVMSQKESSETVAVMVRAMAEKYRLKIYAVSTGNVNSGSDLGSSKFTVVTKPVVAMITGTGVNATDAGEVWHLMDQRMSIPTTHLEPAVFNRVDLNKYNTLILVGGNYNELNKDKLKTWVQAGGTLILTEEAITWAAQNGISVVTFKKLKPAADSTQKLSYTDREQIDGAQQMSGAIFGAEIDPTHPLAYGYNQKTVSLFKANKVYMEKGKNPYASPFYYGSKPLQSGWTSQQNLDAIRNSAAVIVNTVGNGRVINIADNPNFRAFWLGGTKLFMNAIFFGKIIDAASGRADD